MHFETTSKIAGNRPWLVVALTGAAFFYFLIFAQFTFLQRLEAAGLGAAMVAPVLAVMGLFGAGSSLLTIVMITRIRVERLLLGVFIGCALAAMAASSDWMGARGFMAVGALVGVFLGSLTVGIATLVADLAPEGELGRWCGVGVGLAYGLSNLPWVFEASAQSQCLMAAAASVGGIGLAWNLRGKVESESAAVEILATAARDRILYAPWGLAAVTVLFVVLIWFDSAAFYLIQASATLRASSWAGEQQLLLIAAAHLVAAALAGWALDRGWLLWTLSVAMALLVAGYSALPHMLGRGGWVPTALYASGVSLYSTALVSYPGLGKGRVKRPGVATRAAVVFAIAGWLGSGLGIGMAADLGVVPGWFWGASFAAFVLAVAGLLIKRKRSGADSGRSVSVRSSDQERARDKDNA